MRDDNILVAADVLKNLSLELGEVRSSAYGAKVLCNGYFEVTQTLGNSEWGLVRDPTAIHPQFFDSLFIVWCFIIIGKKGFLDRNLD